MKTPTKPKAYAYLRFSSKPQERGDSIRRQTSEAARYAAEHGLELDTEFRLSDMGVSASKGRNLDPKAGLGAFLRAVQEGLIPRGSYFLFEHADRLSRLEAWDVLEIMLPLVKAGITLVATRTNSVLSRDTLRDNVATFITWWVEMHAAYEYTRKLAERVSAAWDGKRARAKKGEALTSMTPGWLTLDAARKYVVIPERAAIVRRVFDEFEAGSGRESIAKRLNADHVETWGKGGRKSSRWHHTFIYRLLVNASVVGTLKLHKEYNPKKDAPPGKRVRSQVEEIDNYFPAVIKRKQFDRVQARLVSKRPIKGEGRANPSAIQHICANLLRCTCGAAMLRANKSGPERAKYLCSAANVGAGCTRHYVPVKLVEAALVENASRLAHDAPPADANVAATLAHLEQAVSDAALECEHLEDDIAGMISRGEHVSSAVNRLMAEREEKHAQLAARLEQTRKHAAQNESKFVAKRLETMQTALSWHGADPSDVVGVNATLREVFEYIVLDAALGELHCHYRHGPPPVVIRYASDDFKETE